MIRTRLHCKYSELKRNQRPNLKTAEAWPRDTLSPADGPRPSERRNRTDRSHSCRKNKRDFPLYTWFAAARSDDGIQQRFCEMTPGLHSAYTSLESPRL